MTLTIGNKIAPIPVIQGGMGVGVSLSNLAGAVAKAGGIGVISTAQIGFRKPEFAKNPIQTNLLAIKEEVEKARAIAPKGIIGVNIMVATRDYKEYVKAAIKAGVDLIISGAGLPVELPAIAKEENSNVALAPIVSSKKSLQVIVQYWMKKYQKLPDAVVIEGPLAGGHLGFSNEDIDAYLGGEKKFEDEVKSIISQVRSYETEYSAKIPVVVGGGVYDREDMERVLALGADGVQVGTRFVTTYECDAHDNYKQTYINAKEEDIVIVKSPVGMPGRAIVNKFMSENEGKMGYTGPCRLCLAKCDKTKIPYCITNALINAALGNTDEALLFCGSNAYRATKLEHVADIMKEFAI